MPVDVFISYRGADRVLARRLEQRLRSRWGSRVFRDETSLVPGRSWSDQLRAVMAEAKVTLALIGPGWQVREKGEDWVRDELLGAIAAGNPVLPVLAGNPDQLKGKLGDLPEAFQQQAVTVSSELAGFDLHEIENALRNLGAFGERLPGGLGRELSETLPDQCDDLISALHGGRSILVSGASGSGRGAMLQRMASAMRKQGGLVAACGIDLSTRSRRTHSVIASWIDGLCELYQERAPEDRSVFGPALVNAILEFGPDLLARHVLRPSLLLPLGHDDSDQKILDAAQRPTDRWAPFPPERLVSQSMSVIEHFVAQIDIPLTLIVDNVESIDGSSKDLLRRLLRSTPKGVRMVLATSAVRDSTQPISTEQYLTSSLDIDPEFDTISFATFESISLHDATIWGEPGAIIQGWLKKHQVQLGKDVRDTFKDTNPYYTLSALWYLVDNGHLIEEKKQEQEQKTKSSDDRRLPDEDSVTWVASRPDEALLVPSRDRLLDHMIEEFIPVRFRAIIEAGALIGRRFLFSAAFAAAHPPESIDGQQASTEAVRRWREKAERCWDELKLVDPDGSVIVCHRSADNERMINFAQIDLMTYLANQLDNGEKSRCHERLAQYFRKPLADDSSESLDDRYRNARAAASHWASAKVPREAADAERVAAGLAEEALAYPEARRHYQRAIRLFTQLLANKEQRSTYKLVDHEDMLILANCLYRLGQMTRLANERTTGKDRSVDPIKYFKQALKRLDQLSENLHDKTLVAPTSERHSATTQRDLPEPNLIRHHIRLCETLSGRIKLELAEWYDDTHPKESRRLLFDALRHAESARGEADSRWLLTASSAQLAHKLVKDAIQAQQYGNMVRAHNLAIEAQFHIERVIGLAAVSPDEDSDLEETRSSAWMVLGRLFQSIQLEPRLAGWAFQRMNEHCHEVSDLVDMMTDRRLGLFLLSQHRGELDEYAEKARKLLQRHKSWAIESGIADQHTGANISLALLELVEQLHELPANLGKAQQYIQCAIDCAATSHQRQNAWLLQALLHAIEQADQGGVSHDHALVLEAFKQAGVDINSDDSSDAETLRTGWKTLLIRLLRWCPHIEDWIGVDRCLQQPVLRHESAWARHRFFSTLVNEKDGELRNALERAKRYIKLAARESLAPSSDQMIWRLLESRVPKECYQHAERTRETAYRLLELHRDILGGDDESLTLQRRDLAYAIAVHEWYRSTDPSRLLTLARESNMPIDGHEWASPKLLSGKLAIDVLDRQYGAARQIGYQRLEKIRSMINNWVQGSAEAGYLDQVFYVAVQSQEPKRGHVDKVFKAPVNQPLHKAYQSSLNEREVLVRQAGLPLVQDLHLLDADSDSVDVDLSENSSTAQAAAR